MGEIKSVKVDNWGVFFLQKLQNFFNKTDFCDLTLQFKDNSQLKVHRLVLSACTDFFNVLEQTCELMEDALVMPAELQADVVVPIVNFMYTGTLEFELKMYGKLLKTAKEMNMTVLLKLLEAHKRTMETSRSTINKVNNPVPKNKRITTVSKGQPQTISVTPAQQPPRRIQVTSNIPTRRVAMKPMQDRIGYKPSANTILRSPPQLQRGPIRFEEPNTHTETYESSFDSISYESKPMKEEPEDYFEVQASPRKRSSPFEQLRKGFNNNKRPAVATFTSPPAKKPNIEDVKEFSEQQRMRKQIAAEFNDDAEFDSIMDDEFHHDDDDEEAANVTPSPSSSNTAAKQQPQTQQASIIIKQSPNEKPTIVVKDSSNSKMDHAKIISEVLRQYPHLVKSNKNIKLKIMPNIGGQSQKIIVKKETLDNMSAEMEQSGETNKTQARQQLTPISQQTILKKPLRGYASASTSSIVKVEPQPAATAASKNTNETSAVPSSAPPPKRRIDSKTMHALIAQGAENTTGPWLCLRCGVNGRPISIPSYRGFRRHLINTHKETIDPALCEYCGWRSKNNRVLHHHMLTEHKVASLLYTFPECVECNKICLSESDLQIHGEQYHPDAHKQQCIYCNKVFVKEMNLYTHMKTFHKRRAREDGVIDFSDDEMDEQNENEGRTTKEIAGDTKIKILSDIALPSTLLKLEEQPSTMEEEEYANESGPKFVNAEGNEMLLTAEQREEIMSQLDQDHDGGVVMVLNESTFPPEDAPEAIADDIKLKLETSDPADVFEDANNEILTAEDTLRGAEITTTEAESTQEENKSDEAQEQHELSDHEERMDDEDHMEWAENLISAHDAHDADDADEEEDNEMHDDKDPEEGVEENESKNAEKNKDEEEKIPSAKPPKQEKADPKKAEDINLKLKMLTGDWSDDEIDDDDEEEHTESVQDHKEKAEEPESSVQAVVDETEKSKRDDTARKLQQEATEEFEREFESELEPEGSLIGEDELTQSSQSEKVEAKCETIKEDTQEEKLEPSADSSKSEQPKMEEVIESSVASDEKKEEKVSEKATKEGKTSRRTSAAKEDETKKTITKDISDAKVPSPSETQKADEDSDEKDDIKEEDKDLKLKPADDVEEESVKSTKTTDEDSVKTPDKVKSLINEWADEDDDL